MVSCILSTVLAVVVCHPVHYLIEFMLCFSFTSEAKPLRLEAWLASLPNARTVQEELTAHGAGAL